MLGPLPKFSELKRKVLFAEGGFLEGRADFLEP
jgi:hypothetical protein